MRAMTRLGPDPERWLLELRSVLAAMAGALRGRDPSPHGGIGTDRADKLSMRTSSLPECYGLYSLSVRYGWKADTGERGIDYKHLLPIGLINITIA